MKYLLLLTILCAAACTRIQPTNDNTATVAPVEFAQTSRTPVPPQGDGFQPGVLPNHDLTPGDTLAVTKDDICVKGYAGKVRSVPSSVKNAVYKEYGIAKNAHSTVEVDHLLSLELSGSNSLKNLWAEPFYLCVNGLEMGAHQKDLAENATHKAICDGQISLEEVQQNFPKDWTPFYRKFVSPTFPVCATH